MSNSQKQSIKDKVSSFCHHKNPFINKLFDLVENNREPDVVSWNPQGTSFIVFNRDVFSQRILPNLFSHKNLPSFTRQLNMYDFKRCKAPRGKLSYSHPFFRKGRSDLLKSIKRSRKSSKSIDTIQEVGPSYEDLLKSNQELKQKQIALENKLKLTYKFISSLMKNNTDAAGSLSNIPELLEELEASGNPESENTEISSQLQLEQLDEISQESESYEAAPRKLVFQDQEKQFAQPAYKLEDPSPRIIDYQNANYLNMDISPFNANMLNTKYNGLLKQEDFQGWDAVMNDMMLTGNYN
mmetsp:Transcript_672/g.745  ORF Transcript_672/g.745 Transcript_672/m.745 type:complete len:297 (-) Transcript_672:126-1016(-)|eukprot:CAMPEP_0176440316 /NCGR_PEP_ID=MMETSP0127-20121128/20492_1 /TAXON_ID=938130 /ORGANISM="Platyophrya macrostoma, Strain WH" /LENGTH=296 /DNA_ID=CAMNT_0017824805 /DNA_START=41 /DNA_END=931 /DNA_ORIENTATION=-